VNYNLPIDNFYTPVRMWPHATSGSTRTIRTLLIRLTAEGTHQEYDCGIVW